MRNRSISLKLTFLFVALTLIITLFSINPLTLNTSLKESIEKNDFADDYRQKISGPNCAETRTIFFDNFTEKDPYWLWRIDGNATNSIIYPPGYANLTIFSNSTDMDYSNSEIYNNTQNEYFRQQAHIYLKNIYLSNGSRGWGFWNGNMDKTQSSIAWFTRLKGPENYSLNGFFAVVQSTGNDPTFYNLSQYTSNLTQWTLYEIDWALDYVAFYIDGVLVVNATENLPDQNCRMDIWVDNAVYDDNWEHQYMNISADSSILLDYIEITEGWIPGQDPSNENESASDDSSETSSTSSESGSESDSTADQSQSNSESGDNDGHNAIDGYYPGFFVIISIIIGISIAGYNKERYRRFEKVFTPENTK